MVLERVKLKDKEVLLLGTAHVSGKSVREVEEALESENPEVVAVELCRERLEQLLKPRKWKDTNLIEVIRSGRVYLFLTTLLLSNFQKRVGARLRIQPGSEMIRAVKLAREKGFEVELVDRPVQVTMKRMMQRISLREKFGLLFSLITGIFQKEEIDSDLIERMKEKDYMNELMKDLAAKVPAAKEVLVDERDSFIAEKLKRVKSGKVLAVIGAGHLDGVKKKLLSKEKVSLRELSSTEKRKSFVGLALKIIIPVAFLGLLSYGFYSKGLPTTLEMLFYWVLVNGFFSALGALLVLAHPLTILTAFVASPLTSLHPFLAVGWFCGIVELKVSTPKVKDFEGLDNISGYKGLVKNNVTKVLMVTAFANLGSVIGTLVAFPVIASLL